MSFCVLIFSLSVCAVSGKSGSEALLLTRDDQVFGIGTNLSGHLGVGDESPRKRLTEIPTLCGKGVKGKITLQKSFILSVSLF